MPYAAGDLTVPSATGNVSVTGLDFEPQAVVFFGTNYTTEDSAITTAGTAIWFGMCSHDLTTPATLRSFAAAFSPDGNAIRTDNNPIVSCTTAGTGAALYVASIVSFNSDGFTVNFTTAAAGGYKVRYLAWGGFDNIAYEQIWSTSSTLTPGWRARSCLSIGSSAGDVSQPRSAGTHHAVTFGGGTYTGIASTWVSSYMTAISYPASSGSQADGRLTQDTGASLSTGEQAHFSGPFMITGSLDAHPTGAGLTDFLVSTDLGGNIGSFVFWDGYSQSKFPSLPAASVNATANTTYGDLDGVDAVLLFSISDAPVGQTANAGAAAGFGVATPSYQACVSIDATPGTTRAAFQSSQYGFCARVDSAGARAGTVAVDGSNTVTLTTELADVSSGSLLSLAFYGPQISAWIPQFYRLIPRIGARFTIPAVGATQASLTVAFSTSGTVTFTGFVLLETGDRIVLEDGTGFLLL